MVDEDTRMESIEAEGKRLIFNYVLVNYEAVQIDSERLHGLLRKPLTQQSCGMTHFKAAYKQGLVVAHRYFGKLNNQIMEVEITERDCF